ncbi:MAG: sporulation protein YhbH [Chloroflexi bacterium]|nr:sporulation protein YhbH [Chloroflexota bacterium]
MPPLVTLSRNDWSLHRKGPIDQSRHNERVKEAIKHNLGEIVSQESIVTSDGKRVVKVPIRSLDLPRFRFDRGRKNHAGQGQGKSKVGDVIGQEATGQGQGPGKGRQAGDQPGIDYYEAEITIDDLATLVFEDLGLPFLEPKGRALVESEDVRFDEVRRTGPMSNLDKRRTIRENLIRNARVGRKGFGHLTNDDLRFKTWERKIKEESNAVVIAMRDVSGSMGEFEKYISRSFYFWMVRFLRTRYTQVQIVFITHHTEAREVDEDTFFNLGESGGTKVSSAYQLALDIAEERYPVAEWNTYPFHFSDGDNWGEVDNQRCLELVKTLLGRSNAFGYGEIQEGGRRSPSTLMSAFGAIRDPHFIGVTITRKEDVYPALKQFFSTRGEAAPRAVAR